MSEPEVRSEESDEAAVVPLTIRESSWDGWIVVDCPGCFEAMHLGENWRELILEDIDNIPPCPDCTTEGGDQWAEDADPIMNGHELWALAGDVIKTYNPCADDDE